MKIKEFTTFHFIAGEAFKLLSIELSDFVRKNKSIKILTISHSIIESKVTIDDKRFMATALVCYSS